MSMSIHESTYYRRQHVTGTGCVLVSIKFGKTPEDGLLVVRRLTLKQEGSEVQFDLNRHIEEILEGVRSANQKHNGCLEVQEIEVVPNDYPQRGQALAAAFEIAEYVLTKNI
ncbi:hypothetical protein K6Q96_06745 [Grimontia kaedaensis]|uniref:Uncharacterized protein n=1 Tax=Grimontia kaedaensis TaxID=2872157 RepID=A0ABY4WXH7_9GAMM|nr:hypothetical protein [Grimontia kaedaensis]USH03685.1 hypothetical protein K6Q96_06745 [Grimontia kaedaensis]